MTRLLDLILKQDDPERSFVKFKDGDDLVLLVNNQGGMSALEMGAVVDETLTQLGTSVSLHLAPSPFSITHDDIGIKTLADEDRQELTDV